MKWSRKHSQKATGDELVRERRRVLEVHQTILDRLASEGAGAVVTDARQNAGAALEIFEPHDVALASVLMVLGTVSEAVGEVEEAEAADRRACEVLLPVAEPDARVQLAALLGNMAVREDGRLDLEKATALREQALSVYREVLPESEDRVGTAVQNLAATWEARDASDRADRVLADHIDLAVDQGDDPEEAAARPPFAAALPVVLGAVADRFQHEGKLDAAEHFYRQAVRSAQQRRVGDVLTLAGTRGNLATLLERLGRFDEARGLMFAALDDVETEGQQEVGQAAEARIQLMNNLGLLQYRSGDLRSALALHEAVLAARRAKTGASKELAESLNNLGLVRGAMGDLPRAWDLMVAACHILESDGGPRFIDAVNNLAWLSRAMGDEEGAVARYEEALRLRRGLYGDRHPAVAESLNNLGVALLAAGQVERARRMLQDGLDLRRAAYGPQHPEVVASLVNLANAQMAADELSEAGNHVRAAWITHLMVDPDRQTPATSMVLFALAQHAILTGDIEQAADALEDALDHENATTDSILGLGSERSRLLRLNSVRGHVDSLISVALDNSPDPSTWASRVYRQVLRRKALGLEFHAYQRASLRITTEQGSAIGRDLDRARDELQRGVHQSADPGALDELRARVRSSRTTLRARPHGRPQPAMRR
jgi:tetratricopeptide (TPR) repeat protein